MEGFMLHKWMNGALAALALAILSIGPAALPIAPAAASTITPDIGAWTTYTPTIAAGTGSFTTVGATGRYKTLGKTVFIKIRIAITTNGTAASWITASLPFNSVNVGTNEGQSLVGLETVTVGTTVTGHIPNNSGTVTITKVDGTYPGGNAFNIVLSGSYERA
jgi:hypothetical protein